MPLAKGAGFTRGFRVRRFIAFLMTAILCFFAEASARAHPILDEVRRLVAEQAEFEVALLLLERAADEEGLTRADVVELLELQALVFHALDRENDLDRALNQLVALEPEVPLASSPPTVQQRFHELAARRGEVRLDLEVEVERTGDGFVIRTQVDGDDHGLIRELRVFHRLPDGDWRRSAGDVVHVYAGAVASLELYAQGLGPGGAVILSEDSEEQPQIIMVERDRSPIADDSVMGGAGDEEPRRRLRAWPFVVVAISTAAVVAIIVAAVFVSINDDAEGETQFSPPHVDWP